MDASLLILAADTTSTGSRAELVISSLLTLGIGGIITTAVSAWFSRRKTAAEARTLDADGDSKSAQAAATLTDSALTLIEPMQREIERLSGRVTALETDRIASMQREAVLSSSLTETRAELAECRAWIQLAHSLIRQAGLPIDPPPIQRPTGAPS